METFILKGNGVNLHTYSFLTNPNKAVVICVHGMAEHGGRYKEIADYLNQKGYSVFSYDHRGHGQSVIDGESLGYQGKDGFNQMVNDLNTVVDYVKNTYPNKKFYLLGHSMGSFVVQRYIQVYKRVSGVILIGSSYKTFGMGFAKFLCKVNCLLGNAKKEGKQMNKLIFGQYNNKFKPSKTDFDWLNRDEAAVQSYIEDEHCGMVLSNQFYHDFMGGLITLQKRNNIAKVKRNLPIYILAGDKDPVGNNGLKVKQLYEAYQSVTTDIDFKLYEGARHEILNEKNKSEVFEDVYNWLEMRNNK
jgi:alpha-beta hydrolase superfamily lysophospholipase